MTPARGGSTSVLAPGREYDFKIVKINPDQHKIGLSYRAACQSRKARNGGIPVLEVLFHRHDRGCNYGERETH